MERRSEDTGRERNECEGEGASGKKNKGWLGWVRIFVASASIGEIHNPLYGERVCSIYEESSGSKTTSTLMNT